MSEIKINISATNGDAITAMQQVEAEQEKLYASSAKMASQYSGLADLSSARSSSINRESQAYRSLDSDLQGLLTKLDPVYKAQQQMDAASDLLHRGLQSGLVTQEQYGSALSKLQSTYSAAADGAAKLEHGSSRAARELMVIGHEAVAGNFSRIPGSFMVLSQALDGFLGPLALVGAAVTGGIMIWEKYKEASSKAAEEPPVKFEMGTEQVISALNKQIEVIKKRNEMLNVGVKGDDATVAYAYQLKQAMDMDLAALQKLRAQYGENASSAAGYAGLMDNLTAATAAYNRVVNAMGDKNTGDAMSRQIEGRQKAEEAAAKKRYADALAEQSSMMKLYDDYGRRQQAYLDNQHNNKLMADSEYYAKKHALALQSMNIDLSILVTEETLAKARGDKRKASEIQSRIEDMQQRLQFETMAGNQYDNILRQFAKSGYSIEQEKYNKELVMLNQAHAQKLMSDAAYYVRLEDLKRNHEATITRLGMEGLLTRQEFEATEMQTQIGIVAGILQGATSQAAQHNRVMFEINKQASAANAIISTLEGATKALSLGPWGIPLAAVIYAAGMINVAAIEDAQYGGGAKGVAPSAGGVSSTAIPGQTANPNVVGSTAPAVAAPAPTQFNLTLKGVDPNSSAPQFTYDQVVNQLAPLLQKAAANGAVDLSVTFQ